MKDTLTKENFWDEMSQKYPKAMAHFLNWIDSYKAENDWAILFNDKGEFFDWVDPNNHSKGGIRRVGVAPKYHELPIAFQFGIFVQFSNEVIKHYRLHAGGTKMETIDLVFETKEFVDQVFNWLEQKGKL
jgi:hypothetical protein